MTTQDVQSTLPKAVQPTPSSALPTQPAVPLAAAAAADAAAPPAQKQNKVLNFIVNALLVLSLVLGVACAFTAYVSQSGDGVPSFFGIRPFSIQSDSMSPFFEEGDLIISYKVTDYIALEVGDVITFWTIINGERVLNSHRIIAIEDYGTYYYFSTQGDNNSIADSLGVHQSEIVGKYITHIPNVGTFIDFLQTSTGFLIVIVVPVLLFFVYNLVSFFKALFSYQAEKMRLQMQAERDAAVAAALAQAELAAAAAAAMPAIQAEAVAPPG